MGWMGDVGEPWAAALDVARLSDEEQKLLFDARDRDARLGDELTFLVTTLGTDLSAGFLRAFVDNLRAALDADRSVIRSLEQTVAASVLVAPGCSEPRSSRV